MSQVPAAGKADLLALHKTMHLELDQASTLCADLVADLIAAWPRAAAGGDCATALDLISSTLRLVMLVRFSLWIVIVLLCCTVVCVGMQG